MALTALGDETWTGRWEMTAEECKALLVLIEQEFPDHNDGSISLEEILHFIRNEKEETKGRIDKLPSCAKGLMVEDLVTEVIHHPDFDHDGSASLDEKEWVHFMERLEFLRLEYLQKQAFQACRAFYGRGDPFKMEK